MTTPKPERMTDEQIAADVMSVGRLLPEDACRPLARIAYELTLARSGEEQAIRERDEARASELALQTECDRLRGCETERDDARLELEFERRRADLAIRDRKAAEAERDEARRERDGYREGAKRLAECLGGYAHESADHKEILGILALRVDAASYGELPELFGRLESELREAQEHAKECGPLRAEVERLKAQIDRMRQRIQELEEHHG